MATELGSLFVRVRADISELEKGMATATRSVSDAAAKMQTATASGTATTVAATRSMSTWGALQAEAAGHVGEHSLAIGRLERSLEGFAARTIGVNETAALLASSLGKFAIGSVEIVAILAGIALVAAAWDKLTEAGRKAKEETDKQIDALRKFGEEQFAKKHPTFAVTSDIAEAKAQREELTREIAALQAKLPAPDVRLSAAGKKIAADLVELRAQLAERNREIKFGEAEKARIEKEAKDKADAEAKAALAALAEAQRKRIEIMNLGVEFGTITLEKELATLNRELGATKTNTDAWIAIQRQRIKVMQDIEDAAVHMGKVLRESIPVGLAGVTLESARAKGLPFLPGPTLATDIHGHVTNAPAREEVAPGQEGAIVGGGMGGLQHALLELQHAGDMLGGAFKNLLTSSLPIAVIMTVVGAAMKPLQPALDALKVPLQMFGEIIGKALVPVLAAFWPVVKQVVIAASYVAQIFFYISGAIYKAVGALVYGIAKFVDAIIPFVDPLKFLEDAGKGMMAAGDGFWAAAGDMAKLREQLGEMTFDDALSRATDGLNQFSDALMNVPSGFKVALAAYNAAAGVPGGATRSVSSDTYNITIQGANKSATQIFDEVDAEAQRRKARGQITAFDLSFSPA